MPEAHTTLNAYNLSKSDKLIISKMKRKSFAIECDDDGSFFIYRHIESSNKYRLLQFFEKSESLDMLIAYLASISLHLYSKEYSGKVSFGIGILDKSDNLTNQILIDIAGKLSEFDYITSHNGKYILPTRVLAEQIEMFQKETMKILKCSDFMNTTDLNFDKFTEVARQGFTCLDEHYDVLLTNISPNLRPDAHWLLLILLFAHKHCEQGFLFWEQAVKQFLNKPEQNSHIAKIIETNTVLSGDAMIEFERWKFSSPDCQDLKPLEIILRQCSQHSPRLMPKFDSMFVDLLEIFNSLSRSARKNNTASKLDKKGSKSKIKTLFAQSEQSIALMTDFNQLPNSCIALLDIEPNKPMSMQERIVHDDINRFVESRSKATGQPLNEVCDALFRFLKPVEFELERLYGKVPIALRNIGGKSMYHDFVARNILSNVSASEALFYITSTQLLLNWFKYYNTTPSDALSMDTLSDYMRHDVLSELKKC